VTHLTVPAVPASSSFVADSRHLAEQMNLRHPDLLRDLRRIQKSRGVNFTQRTYMDIRNKQQPMFLLTVRDLMRISTHLPKLRSRVEVFTELLIAQLQAAKAPKDPFYLETNDYGTKVVRKIPEDKQTGLIFNEEGELCRALLCEMDSEQRFFAWAGLDEDRAHGILRAHVRKKDWLVQARQKIAKGLEPAPMTAFGLKSQGEASFVRLLRDELTRE